ncbi:MAG: YebC/PmpR family DNA-binding transcriptional regulator [Nitriliruptorales bacterium]
MSGHSKWSTIKHRKGAADARRGKLFGRLTRAVEVASREGGGDPDANPTLADAIQRAKDNSVPKDTIERAVKRGAGELEGTSYEAVQYEGYGPNGVAVLVDCLTDNRNRTASDIRSIFTKNGGSLAEPGAVGYLFSRRGQVVLGSDGVTEDDILAAGLDAGLEDVTIEDHRVIAWCAPTDTRGLREALEGKGLPVREAASTMVPSTLVPITERDAVKRLLRLLDAIDDNDDVQDLYSNEDIPDEVIPELSAE